MTAIVPGWRRAAIERLVPEDGAPALAIIYMFDALIWATAQVRLAAELAEVALSGSRTALLLRQWDTGEDERDRACRLSTTEPWGADRG